MLLHIASVYVNALFRKSLTPEINWKVFDFQMNYLGCLFLHEFFLRISVFFCYFSQCSIPFFTTYIIFVLILRNVNTTINIFD